MKRLPLIAVLFASSASAQLAVRGDTVYTMAGPPIQDGIVIIEGPRISRVGPAASTPVPAGYRSLRAQVVTPGLIDAHTVVGLSGYLNQAHDQDQIERSTAIQPDLRAIDAYNPLEELVSYIRGYGVTTIHTGHGPGSLISGQTMIVKTSGKTVEEALVKPVAMVAATLGAGGRAEQGKSPGTRSKMVAMLRGELIRAREYAAKRETSAAAQDPPAQDLKLDVLARVLKGELPLLVTVHRMHDIMTAIRVGKEFNLKLVLDGVAEAHGLIDEIRASGYPVIVHPTMARAAGETENLSLETASKLRQAGILFAFQSGFESYVPKTRVVLFEAGMAAANGLGFEQALAAVTVDAARLLGIAGRVGTLEPGKDADIALYDGDPFEYATHCTGVVLNGALVSEEPR
jgi:imidazolonepropionase-like amidohydrolase